MLIPTHRAYNLLNGLPEKAFAPTATLPDKHVTIANTHLQEGHAHHGYLRCKASAMHCNQPNLNALARPGCVAGLPQPLPGALRSSVDVLTAASPLPGPATQADLCISCAACCRRARHEK